MIRVRNGGVAVFFMLGVLSCSGGSTGPDSGLLTLELHSPNGDDGAVMFTITGGPVDSIEAEGLSMYSASINSTTLRVVITGELHSGTLARIRIPDRDQASHYSGVIEQVAQRGSYIQRDPTGYELTVTK
jgi:hypothetical protein